MWTAVLIILFDYVIAYSVIGLSAMFKKRMENQRVALVLGIMVTFLLRLACHYISGVAVWEVLWPNELGWAAPIWSISYNASYMVPEIIITGIVAAVSYRPLRKYYPGKITNGLQVARRDAQVLRIQRIVKVAGQ